MTLPSVFIWKLTVVTAPLILIIITSLNGVFQFIGGKSFGRRKIVPHLSPNKTEAGFITGIFGDLFMSSVKRSVGVKDFSDLIPGHGGLLDWIDGLIFTAPTFLLALLVLLEVRA